MMHLWWVQSQNALRFLFAKISHTFVKPLFTFSKIIAFLSFSFFLLYIYITLSPSETIIKILSFMFQSKGSFFCVFFFTQIFLFIFKIMFFFISLFILLCILITVCKNLTTIQSLAEKKTKEALSKEVQLYFLKKEYDDISKSCEQPICNPDKKRNVRL